jgi:hypothetical protein
MRLPNTAMQFAARSPRKGGKPARQCLAANRRPLRGILAAWISYHESPPTPATRGRLRYGQCNRLGKKRDQKPMSAPVAYEYAAHS